MAAIYHGGAKYGGGSLIEPNPQGTPANDLESIGIDGVPYSIVDTDAIHSSDVGIASGVAELDVNGKVPASQLPSYVDDVIEAYYDSVSDRFYEESTFTTVIQPESGKTWVDIPANKSYRWTGSVYVRVDEGVQLGETSDTAYRGDRGKIAYDHSQSDHSGIKPTFTEASTRANIASGESFATILGKIKKWFSDLKDLAFIGKDGTSSTKYLRGDGTWQNFPTIPTVNDATLTIQKNGTAVETFTANASADKTANITVPTKVSDLTDDVVSGHYLPLTGGTLTGNLNVSNNGASDTALYVRGNSQGAYIGFHNANGGTTYGYYGVKNDNLPYFYANNTSTRIALTSDIPAAVAVKGDKESTYRTGNVNLTPENIGAVPIRDTYDTYTQLAKWYGGTIEPPYVRIAFPTGISTVWTMLNIEILFRQNYANDLGGKILINCHHTTTSPYAWVGNAFVYGFVRKSDIKVYGSDGRYLYIKGIDSYTTLSIEKVLVGDTARSIDLTSTTIDYVSALPSTYQTFTMYTDVDSSNIANQSVSYATTAGSATNAVLKTGDTMSGNLLVKHAGDTYVQATNTTTGNTVYLDSGSSINHGLYSAGYYTGSSFVNDGKWMLYRDGNGGVILNGNAPNDGDGNTISSTYAKKPLYATGSVGSGKTGTWKIAEITLSEVGTYYITGWANFTGPGKKAVQLWCAGTLGESWEDSTISVGEPKVFSAFAIYTSSVAGEVVKVNSYTVSNSNAVTGGLIAIKVS